MAATAAPLDKVPTEVMARIFEHLSRTWSEDWPTEYGGPIGSWYPLVVSGFSSTRENISANESK